MNLIRGYYALVIVICWKHIDIPKLAQSLGCSVQNGCPFHYYHNEYD